MRVINGISAIILIGIISEKWLSKRTETLHHPFILKSIASIQSPEPLIYSSDIQFITRSKERPTDLAFL